MLTINGMNMRELEDDEVHGLPINELDLISYVYALPSLLEGVSQSLVETRQSLVVTDRSVPGSETVADASEEMHEEEGRDRMPTSSHATQESLTQESPMALGSADNNFCRLLQHYLADHHLPVARYATVTEPHIRDIRGTGEFIMNCHWEGWTERGRGKTKKEARHSAAAKLLTRVQAEEEREEAAAAELAAAKAEAAQARQEADAAERSLTCAVCLVARWNTGLSCGHVVCGDCFLKMSSSTTVTHRCHMCRSDIASSLRLYF